MNSFKLQHVFFIFLTLSIAACNFSSNDNALNEGLKKKLKDTKNPVSADVLNGMKWEEFENFYRDWRMVTSTFRTDRDQLRVIFANDIAWKALNEGKSFPDGAMFAKTGFQVEEDERFPSSKIPSNQLRLMVMKRDHKLYPDTDGWGYALMNRRRLERLEKGEVPEKYESITDFQTSCHACHQLASNTDFVFSKPMLNNVLGRTTSVNGMETLISKFQKANAPFSQKVALEIFQEMGVDKKHLENLWYMEMPLFEGALPELRASLTKFTGKNNHNYLVFDPASQLYALSIPENSLKKCKSAQKYYTGCLDKKIPRKNMVEVTHIVTICDGQELTH